MMRFKFFTTLVAMMALSYGIVQMQSFLDTNFVENDTPIKAAFNKFLNGELELD